MEEEIIYEIVDNIINNQDKIAELVLKMECPINDDVYQKEILYKDYLDKNMKKIKKYKEQKKINEHNLNNFINDSNSKLEKIENQILKINNKIKILDSDNKSDNNELYKKSYEKVKNIILNKQNEENLKKLNKKYSNINSKKNGIIKDIKNNELKKNKLSEIANMLEEEKDVVDMKIVEYMSLKESYEEIAKLELKIFLSKNWKDSTINYNNADRISSRNILDETGDSNLNININEDISDIKIYFYEINILDIHELCKGMSYLILNLIDLYIKYTEAKKNNINNNNDIYNSFNNLLLNKSSGIRKISRNMSEIIDDKNSKNNFDFIINKSNTLYNKPDINSLILILSSKIEKPIITYLVSSENYIENKNYINNFTPLFESIGEIITSFMNLYYSSYIEIKSNYSSLNLILFIKYFIKSFYYENIMSNEIYFIEEQYKNNTQVLKNIISLAQINNNKLNSKKNEYLLLRNQLEEKIKCINGDIKNNNNDLTDKEMEFIELNQKLNDLKHRKKEIKNELAEVENQSKYTDEELDNKINDLKDKNNILQKNILSCQEELKLKNKQYKKEIKKLKNDIKDNFGVIKNQIALYKKKYGDNIELYNKFIKRINDTLKLTNETIFKEDDVTPNNSQSTFYKSDEKRCSRKKFFTPEKNIIDNNSRNCFY